MSGANGTSGAAGGRELRLGVDDAVRALTSSAAAGRWLGAKPAGLRLHPGCPVALPRDGRTGEVVSLDDHRLRLRLVEPGGDPSVVEARFHASGPRRSTLQFEPAAADLEAALDEAEAVVFDVIDRRTPRQAVVLIHGIGEQTPGSTLRSFASAVIAGDQDLLSKPDRFGPHFELRRLQAWADDAGDRPRTDFFEYYWAHKLRDTPRRQVVGWLVGLARRPRRETPPQLHTLWWLVRLLPVLLALLAAALVAVVGVEVVRSAWARVAGFAPLAFVLAAVSGGITTFLTTSLGDAARYLKAHPANVEVRTSIREGGIDLLRRLEDSGRYHRIVVVGHSLGSVIAYDVLTHHFAARHAVLRHRLSSGQPGLEAYEAKAAGVTPATHQELQHHLWAELRRAGSPWLVTDLVTLGSPLAHALLLMADNRVDLARRQRSRELPVSPPVADRSADGSVSDHPYSYQPVPRPGWPYVPHHGAVFGPCRWTNAYFPAIAGLFGDPVGGPLAPVFGGGIRDIPVTRSSGARWMSSHSAYWRPDPTPVTSGDRPDALTALREALGLSCRSGLGQLAGSLPVEEFVPAGLADAF